MTLLRAGGQGSGGTILTILMMLKDIYNIFFLFFWIFNPKCPSCPSNTNQIKIESTQLYDQWKKKTFCFILPPWSRSLAIG